jgi:hypothetical protein
MRYTYFKRTGTFATNNIYRLKFGRLEVFMRGENKWDESAFSLKDLERLSSPNNSCLNTRFHKITRDQARKECKEGFIK